MLITFCVIATRKVINEKVLSGHTGMKTTNQPPNPNPSQPNKTLTNPTNHNKPPQKTTTANNNNKQPPQKNQQNKKEKCNAQKKIMRVAEK